MPRLPSLIAVACLVPLMALAQGANVTFGGLRQDTSLPVEVTADSLQINQADGAATFEGNVLVSQGDIRMSAGEVRVVYAEEAGRISELRAIGGVTFVSGSDAAEAEEAVYDIDSGRLVMSGDVLLTQGPTALSAQRMVVDLRSGTGALEGGVRTVFQPGGN
jgi:lipopolysaccharide export system protein LptA